MTANDLDLLREFVRDQSQDAFTALVRRHLDLVYCAALRQVRSPQLAEEVAQSVFADLARNAARLKSDTVLAAWLYQVTRRTAINVVRGEARRQLREQIASEMNAMNATTADWTRVEPLLDEAMHALDDTDRTAVLLRYFENKSLREVGAALGTSDDTAQKRVSRAVERLREFFAKRGVTVGASSLVLVLSANAVQAAPVGINTMLATGALASAATVGPTFTQSLLIAMKLKTTIILAVVLIGALFLGGGAGWYWLRHHNRASGLAGPPLQASLDRFMAAVRAGDTNRLMQCVSWRVSAEVPPAAAMMVRAPLLRNLIKVDADRANLRVLGRTEEGEGVVLARVEWLNSSGRSKQASLRFAREADGWKPAFNIYRSPSGGYGGTLFLSATP